LQMGARMTAGTLAAQCVPIEPPPPFLWLEQ
jgi:hypothetical protein